MIKLTDVPPDAETRSKLAAAARQVSEPEDAQLGARLEAAVTRARAVSGHWEFAEPANALDAMLSDHEAFPEVASASGHSRLRRAVVARCLLEHFQVEDRLPDCVIALYEAFWRRLGDFLTDQVSDRYDDDYFAKDVRYALGLTVPCGVLQIDLDYSVGPKLILRDAMASASLDSVRAYLTCKGWGRWYNDHLDLRAMEEFNPAGWTACFVRMAEVLALNPTVCGITGISWFYDPKVAAISPRLAYLQVTQTQNGAFLANMGTDEHHVQNATVRSAARKALYDEGKYLPTCYLVAWPSRPLIEWADRLATDPTLAFGGADDPIDRLQPG